jgi:hypothetical protein
VLERTIEQKVCKWAKFQGIQALKLTCTANTGWPDRMFLYQGRTVFIEFKAPGRKLARNQLARWDWLNSNGFTVRVFDDAEAAISFLETALLSVRGCEAGSVPSVRGAAVPSGRREDVRDVHDPVNTLAAEVDKGRARDLPNPAHVQRVAAPKGRI